MVDCMLLTVCRNHSISELARRSPGSLTFPRDRRVPDEAKDLIIRLLQVGLPLFVSSSPS